MRAVTNNFFVVAIIFQTVRGTAISSRAPPGAHSVIAQMFEWTWDSIAAECTAFLGPTGYGYVQTSPPQEHVTGDAWWTDYQPVSYILTSKRGNREQFASMISTCHNAGVRVIADAVLNHMAGSDSGIGTAGSTYTHYNYPGIYQTQDFHHCGLEPGDDIVNYNNALEVQTCELVNLADLDTGAEYVRSRLAEYVNDLLSLDVDGLRLDAAKHISVEDLSNVTSRFTGSPYLTQEVIYGAGEPITPNQYTSIGDVQEFRYTSLLKDAFLNSGIQQLRDLDNLGWVPGSGANVFVTNHDTERNGNSLNNDSPNNAYTLAMIFSLAHPYGTPTILSSYNGFENNDAGSPDGGAGTCSGNGGSNGWFCQHRWIAIAGMVGWRNTVGTTAMTNWVSPSSNRIAFDRGSAGFVAINNEDSTWSTTFTTSLPDGSYCDVIHEISAIPTCGGTTYTVSGGSFSATISARDALALHTI
ncbi:glycoside hydrolase superfamily [Vararia minispora EC-137]|uniref:Glycoside hydrolase superfamily n=1 Tax=Vararia minispora EC-137 TaxID=1314806 RepID=A0ACB8QAE5_9AGAM|nr:glycoside hydrolase superfamily [Vararia minispora EC-137]